MRERLLYCLARAPRRPLRSDRELLVGRAAGLAGRSMRREAAVLVPIVAHPSEPATVLLTRRADGLPEHAGQIAFPGGAIEPRDRHPEAAALRETHEEVGLDPAHIEPLGRLDPYETITGYRIAPVVALVTPPLDIRPDPREVAEVFEVPLDFVIDPANHQCHHHRAGEGRRFYAIVYKDYYIWGATAHMLVNLSEVLRDRARQPEPGGADKEASR